MLTNETGTLPEEQRAGAPATWCVQEHGPSFSAVSQWKPPEDSERKHVRPYAWYDHHLGLIFTGLLLLVILEVEVTTSRTDDSFLVIFFVWPPSDLTKLYLHENAWQCDCNIITLVQWMGRTKASLSPRDALKCKSPPELRNKSLYSLQADKLSCRA